MAPIARKLRRWLAALRLLRGGRCAQAAPAAARLRRRAHGRAADQAGCGLLRGRLQDQHRGVQGRRDLAGRPCACRPTTRTPRAELRQQPLDLRGQRAHRRRAARQPALRRRRWSSSRTITSCAPRSPASRPSSSRSAPIPSRSRAATPTRSSTTSDDGTVRLTDDAWLSDGQNEISGPLLVYNIRAQRVQAATAAGHRAARAHHDHAECAAEPQDARKPAHARPKPPPSPQS